MSGPVRRWRFVGRGGVRGVHPMSVPYRVRLDGSPGRVVPRTLPGMAKHGWIASVALSVGAAAGAAAAQFGLGYGLGILSWSPGPGETGTTDSAWLASLAWTTWIAATSTVLGAILADRRSEGEIGAAPPRPVGVDGDRRLTPPGVVATASWRALLSVAAAVGAALSVALVLVPAREAVRADTSSPQVIAAGYAIVGVVLGIVMAVCALTARAAAANAVWSAGWLWLLAIAAVIDGVIVGRGLHTEPLSVWPFGSDNYIRETWSIEGAALMLGAAFLIGAGAAWQASRRGDSQVGIVLSGGLGPMLVVVAYFATAPSSVGVRNAQQAAQQFSAYLVSPFAVLAGIGGSVLLVAVLTGREASLRRHRAEDEAFDGPSWPPVPPQRPAQPSTADVLAGSASGARGQATVSTDADASTGADLFTPTPAWVDTDATEDLDAGGATSDAVPRTTTSRGAGRRKS